MSTSMIHFTKDPDEDITNAPQYYHDFGGAAVRIKTYRTTPVWSNPALLAHSFRLIKTADSILRKYTLKLDSVPWGPSPAARAAVRKAFYANAAKHGRAVDLTLRQALGHVLPLPVLPKLCSVADQQAEDNLADTADGQLNYNYSTHIPDEATPSIEELKPIRKLIEPVVEENRLIVVFTPLDGGSSGYTSVFGDWLPWVLVDPKHYSYDTYLLHEIGHACRLAHQQFGVSVDPHAPYEAYKRFRNVMSYFETTDRFWGWQVDAIYDSYWCTGSRPKNWWEALRAVHVEDYPYLWDEPP